MEDPTPALSLEKLVAHREWVRRVARALVRDEALAEDLEQEVWLEALQSPPRSGRSFGGWLAAAMRHNLIDLRRSEDRRRVREQAIARPEAEKSVADLVVEAETHKEVVAAVLRLDEPYRGTLLLRYFENLPLKEVARRQGVPLESVRTRVRRAIELLRDRLDAERGGDRKAWCLALLPLVRKPEVMAPAGAGIGTAVLLGEMVMAKKAIAIVAVLLLLGGVGWFALSDGRPVPMPRPAGSAPQVARVDGRTQGPASQTASPSVLAASPFPAAPCHLRAIVLDPALHPISGARAEVRPASSMGISGDHLLDSDDPAAPAVASGTSAADGILAIPLPAGRWAVTIRADGYGVAGAKADLQEGTAEDSLRIVLYPAAILEGTVLRSPGTPRPGVVVEAHPFGNDVLHARVAATADGAGKYRLVGLPLGRLVVSVRLPCSVIRTVGVVDVPGTSRFDILLPGGMAVRGRVVDDATGESVQGAEVGVSLHDVASGLSASGRTVSGRDGTFAFEDLPPGRIAGLSVRRKGYLAWPDGGPSSELDSGALAVVRGSGSIFEKEVRLRRGAVVRGRVMLGDGTPVPGAEVSFMVHVPARGMMQPRSSPPAYSGLDGSYVASCVFPGPNVARVEASGYCAPGSQEAGMMGTKEDLRWAVEVPVVGEVEKDLVLVRGADIEGAVVDGNGRPVPGARVGIQAQWREEWSSPTVPAGPDGTFRFAGAPPGDLRLLARGAGGIWGSSNRLTLQEGGTLNGVRIVTSPGAVLAGTVLGEDGNPITGARLSIHVGGVANAGKQGDPGRFAWLRASGRVHPVEPDGRFRIEGLANGTWTIHAMAPGRSPAYRTIESVRAGSVLEDLRLVLLVGGTLAGKVLDPAGNPVAGASVSILPAWSGPGFYDGMAPSGTVSTDDAGRFRQEGLEEGDHLIRVAAPGHAAYAAVVPAGSVDFEVRLSLPLAIAGRVLLESGGPAAGVVISASAEKRVPGVLLSFETVTAGDGAFRIEGVTAGTHTLYVGGYGGDVVRRKLEGVAAGTVDLAVTLTRGLAIRGRLVDERNRAVPGAQVRVQGEGESGSGAGRNGLAQTLTDGTFSIDGLLPGTYTVTVWILDPRWSAPPPVTGVRAGEAELILKAGLSAPSSPTPPDGDLRIEGTVVLRGGGPPPAGTLVIALPATPAASVETTILVSARTDDRGGFLLDRLREGRYRIIAAWHSTTLAPGWLAEETEAGGTGLVVEVSSAVAISGRIAGTGAEKVRWIRAFPKGAPSAAFSWREVGDDGSFNLTGLPEGSTQLQGMLRAGGSMDLGPAVAPGENVEVRVP